MAFAGAFVNPGGGLSGGFGPLTVEEDDAGAGIAQRHRGAKSRLLAEDARFAFR